MKNFMLSPGSLLYLVIALTCLLFLPIEAALGGGDAAAAEANKPDIEVQDNEVQDNPGSANAEADAVSAGRSIYNNTCIFCHGDNGKGARAPGLVTGPFAPGGGNTDEYMFKTIKQGRPGTIMGSFDGMLTDEQIRQVIAYLRHEAALLAEQ